MKSDLDTLMQDNQIDALLITGPGQHNPEMVYLTGISPLTNADLIKKQGHPPVLYHHSMERDEAAATGLQTKNLADYDFNQLLKNAGGDRAKAIASRYQCMLTEQGITSGRLGLYGRADAGASYSIFTALRELMPDLTLVGEQDSSVMLKAMSTKDPEEVDRIRRMGKITTEVVGRVAEFLSGHVSRRDTLIKTDGEPLTIGEVKRKITLWLAEMGVENLEGTIFSIGRDAGVPHTAGSPADLIRLGQTIVFDIFPCEMGGGYFYDFTRTWCLGYAPDEVLSAYENVYTVYNQILEELAPGTDCRSYQLRACELFESQGHPTILSQPMTVQGFVHGLGHGLGLNIHERPMFSLASSAEETLQPGVVITVEPGLYYPDQGFGVRLEDSVYIAEDGRVEILAEFPLDLVLPIRSRQV